MVWWDKMAGQRLAIAGVDQNPRSNRWNFVSGVSAVYNLATATWDLTVAGGGGGGSAHTIQDEGSSLTQRSALNFVGPNVTVTDSGGKTVVTVPAINLGGAGVTGTLPLTSIAAGFVRADGSVAMAADLNLGGNQASNAADAVASTDLTTLQQVNALIAAAGGGGGGTGDVVGPGSSVSGRLVSFGDTTGKNIADSGFSTTAVAPAAVTKATAVAGTATSFSRSDHKHDVSTAAPGAVSVSGVSAAEGSATTLARSDHTHSLTGTLPVANGGTGLTALGSALTYLRVNAGGTALEWASVAGGVTAGNGLTGTSTLSVLAENSTIAVGASGIKRAAITGDVTIADGSNASAIAANAVTTSKIADANVTAAKLSSLAITDIPAVDLATTANVTLSGEQTIDGTLTSSSRVLVWKNSTASQNGIYVTGAGAWTRATDADATGDFRPFVFFGIKGGTANGGKVACLITATAITVGSTSIAYAVAASSPISGTDDNKVGVAQSGQIVYQLLTWASHAAGAAKGNSPVYNGSSWGEFGVKTRATDLGDANATLAVADGGRAVLPATTLTANRQGQFSLTGATDKEVYTVERYDTTAFTYAVKNSAGVTLYTFPASTRRMATFQFSGGEWVFVSHTAIN